MSFNIVDYLKVQPWTLIAITVAGAIVIILFQNFPPTQGTEIPLPIAAAGVGSVFSFFLLIFSLLQRHWRDPENKRREQIFTIAKLDKLTNQERRIILQAFVAGSPIVHMTAPDPSANLLCEWGLLVEANNDLAKPTGKDRQLKANPVYFIPGYIWDELSIERYPWLAVEENANRKLSTSIVTYCESIARVENHRRYTYKIKLVIPFCEEFGKTLDFQVRAAGTTKSVFPAVGNTTRIQLAPRVTFEASFDNEICDCWLVPIEKKP